MCSFIPIIRSVTTCDLCVKSKQVLVLKTDCGPLDATSGLTCEKTEEESTTSSASISGGKCSHERKGYTDTVGLDVQDKPRVRCATVTVRSLSWYQMSLQLFQTCHGGWPWVVWHPPLAVSKYLRHHWHRSSLLSVISLPSSFWCPQVLQFPLLSLSNSAHVRTLINQCQVTECTTRAVFFNCPLSPHTSHCSKKLIQMARKQPMQHIKEMRQKWKESRRGKKRGGIFFPWNTRINTQQW